MYTTKIAPNRSWWRIDLASLWDYRDLLRFLIYRDFSARYKQTLLGPLWFIIQPLATTLVFSVIFGQVAQIPTDGLPPVLFYLGGLLGWTYFASTLNGTSATFLTNQHLYGKVWFPRLVSPLATAAVNSLAFALNTLVFTAFFLYFKLATPLGPDLPSGAGFLLLPPLLLLTALLSLGIGLWISAFTARYRDLQFLLGFLTQLWMYATPIVYPLSQVPEKYRWIANLNPMTQVIETFKYALLGAGTLSLTGWIYTLTLTLTLLYTGTLIFQRTERTVVDTV
jgi:lipopolysaccharide transport system permease protein